MPTRGTTVGPITPETRDRIKDFRDQKDQPNYDAALRTLLEEATEDE
jgi:hypothetical protein